MTKEDKELLLKDICARLTYGVICQVDDGAAGLNDGKLIEIGTSKELARFDADWYWDAYIDDIKPYLRSMSSMTKEEKKEYHSYCDYYYGNYFDTVKSIDWLNKHHFDYRGLIVEGLALEAPNGMYEKKKA